MLSILAAFAIGQAVIIDRVEQPEDAPITAEIVQRPAGMTTSAFLAELVAEAGAAAWERSDHRGTFEQAPIWIVGFRRPEGDGIMFVPPVDEQGPGNICRIRRVREGPPETERNRLIQYCLRAVAEGR